MSEVKNLCAYEAMDRVSCIQQSIDANLIEHMFYDESPYANSEYKLHIDNAMKCLSQAYQVAGNHIEDVIIGEKPTTEVPYFLRWLRK